MKRLSVLFVGLMLAACAPADDDAAVESEAPAAAADDSAAVDSQIRALVQKHQDAYAAGNHSVLDSIFAAEAIFVQAGGGQISSHDERLGKHRDGVLKMHGPPTFEILSVTPHGDDFAIAEVRGTAKGEDHGKAWNGSAIMVMGFARTAGGPWELVYHQGVLETK